MPWRSANHRLRNSTLTSHCGDEDGRERWVLKSEENVSSCLLQRKLDRFFEGELHHRHMLHLAKPVATSQLAIAGYVIVWFGRPRAESSLEANRAALINVNYASDETDSVSPVFSDNRSWLAGVFNYPKSGGWRWWWCSDWLQPCMEYGKN